LLVIDAELLQIEQQGRLDGQRPLVCLVEQRRQILLPLADFGFAEL
jgi:hypothetical protein